MSALWRLPSAGWTLPVRGTLRDFEQAQVTAGGLDWRDFSTRKRSNPAACPASTPPGEVLDVDGPCGGLQPAMGVGLGADCGGAHAPG